MTKPNMDIYGDTCLTISTSQDLPGLESTIYINTTATMYEHIKCESIYAACMAIYELV
jgi:hypothetical protein